MGLGSDLTPLYFWTFIFADCTQDKISHERAHGANS